MTSRSPRRRGTTRRQFLLGGAVAGASAATAIGADLAAGAFAPAPPDAALHGESRVPFHGAHQAGIETDAQAHAVFIALDLRDEVDRSALQRLMRILTDDAVRLTDGRPALADSEPELAALPARLTVTFGFGPALVERADGSAPTWLAPLPAFRVDRLQAEYSDGDLLIQVAGDDPIAVAHAVRMLLKDSRRFATIRWQQRGFRRASGAVTPGTTMRNLFGQLDGSANPRQGSDAFARVVWSDDGWLTGGTGAVLRRIRMDLEGWDRLDRGGREAAVGRTLTNGAPLTGTRETDEPDLDATTSLGFPKIPAFAHLRRARGDGSEQIYRRGYNYDDQPAPGSVSDSGLIFVSFQADVERQFVPMQRRLDDLDLLNEWTIPIGSAVFAIAPGCEPDGYIGESLLR